MDGTRQGNFIGALPDMDSREAAAAWRLAYARQALSDFTVYDLLCSQTSVDECQRMHYLQMALEKSAKAHFWNTSGSSGEPSKINRSHRVVEKFLPMVFRDHWRIMTKGKRPPGNAIKAVRQLCQEVDLLAPAVKDGHLRRDNCEYPWEVVDPEGTTVAIRSPLDHEFSPSSMVRNPRAAAFLKAIRASVQGIVKDD